MRTSALLVLLAFALRAAGLTQDAVMYTVPKVARLVQRGHFSSALNHLRTASLNLLKAAAAGETIVVDGINASAEDAQLLESLGSASTVLRVREADVLMLQASVLRSSGQLDAAADAATRSLEVLSRSISTSSVFFADESRLGGTLLMDAGRYGAALAALTAPAPTAWSQQHRLRLAEAHGRLGDYAAARRHYALLAEDWRRPIAALMMRDAAEVAPRLRPPGGGVIPDPAFVPVASGWLSTAGLGSLSCLLPDLPNAGVAQAMAASASSVAATASPPPSIAAELFAVLSAHNAEIGARLGSSWFSSRVLQPALMVSEAEQEPADAAAAAAPPPACDADGDASAEPSSAPPLDGAPRASPSPRCTPAPSPQRPGAAASWRAVLRQACGGGGGAASANAPHRDVSIDDDDAQPPPLDLGQSALCAAETVDAAALFRAAPAHPSLDEKGDGGEGASDDTLLPMASRRDAPHPLSRDWPSFASLADVLTPAGHTAASTSAGLRGNLSTLALVAASTDLGTDSTLVPLPTALLQVTHGCGVSRVGACRWRQPPASSHVIPSSPTCSA